MPPSTYLLVALGGALGSVARAWMTVAVARALGGAFPWGTIAINVLGSFVIAFFGALTVAHGRWPASANVRVFVMVGLCGGFTTFSSFSLQTLDLARDGRIGAALGNVGVSVFSCVSAAALGFWAASALSFATAK